MKTIKIIDLLNKIANGEELPYRIKYNERIYEYVEEIKWYLRDDLKNELTNSKKCLNDEVEIIEDTPKEDKKIEYFDDYKINARCFDELVKSINLYIELSTNKINEIIDKINGE